jgi:hypothetical protein
MSFEIGDSHILVADATGAVGGTMRDVNWTLSQQSLLPGGAFEQDTHHFTLSGYEDLFVSSGANTRHYYSTFNLVGTTTYHQLPFAWVAKRLRLTCALVVRGTGPPNPLLAVRLYKGTTATTVFRILSNGAGALGMKTHQTTTTVAADGSYTAGQNFAVRVAPGIGATPAYWGSVSWTVECEALA